MVFYLTKLEYYQTNDNKEFMCHITCPISSHKVSLKLEAVVITCGNCVAPRNVGRNFVPGPTSDTPCNASDHHSYPWIPSRGTAAALFTSNLTFSCKVNLPSRSLTRVLIGRFTRQNGRLLVTRLLGSQAKGGLDCAVNRTRKPVRRKKRKDGEIIIMHLVWVLVTIFGVKFGLEEESEGTKGYL